MTHTSTEQPIKMQIEWRDDGSDWPWFWLLGTNGEWLHLQGADYPDGSAKHDGDCFWAHKSEVQTMRSNVGKPPIRRKRQRRDKRAPIPDFDVFTPFFGLPGNFS